MPIKATSTFAGMAESADAADSKSVVSEDVRVQVPLSAPELFQNFYKKRLTNPLSCDIMMNTG